VQRSHEKVGVTSPNVGALGCRRAVGEGEVDVVQPKRLTALQGWDPSHRRLVGTQRRCRCAD
jgi:hypothetical protein